MSARTAGAGLVVVATLLASGCGDSERESETVKGTAPTSSPATPTTSATTTATDGIDPLAGAGTNPVVGEPEGASTALLTRVGIGRHEGYDRVVFEFRNAVPGYRVEYVEPPLHEDGSGNRLEVAGSAFVVVRMEPASGFDLSVPEGELVYKGPRRLSGPDAGTSVVREVVRTGDFEAVLTWAVGLSDRVDFRVRTLQGPPRLVVDVRNH
jgi:hypothetical protein